MKTKVIDNDDMQLAVDTVNGDYIQRIPCVFQRELPVHDS